MTAFVTTARPEKKSLLSSFAIVGLASLFLALMAQLQVPLWFTPVPLSMAPLALMLMGAVLGAKRAGAAALAYVCEGAMGLPFFAGGTFGVAKLLGPTGGYLIGYVVAAFLIGLMLERGAKNSILKTALAMTLGLASLLFLGMVWLAKFIGLSAAFKLGVMPFLVGDCIKIALATGIAHTAWKIIKS